MTTESTTNTRRKPQLHALVAVEKGLKVNQALKGGGALTKAYQALQVKSQEQSRLFGLSRTYQPTVDGATQYPDESKVLQLRASDVIRGVGEELKEVFDVVATKELGNTIAKADIILNPTSENPVVFLKDIPVSYLLWLEARLVDLNTFVRSLPTLPPDEEWRWDSNQNCFASVPKQVIKTKKTPRSFTKAAATEHHPAQAEIIFEDIPEGTWTAVKFSGALSETSVNKMKNRVQVLLQAVKFARESANNQEVTPQKVGEDIFKYLFLDVLEEKISE